MVRAYVAVGHGLRNGKHDPGAVYGEFVEHDWADKIAHVYASALERNGVDVVLSEAGSPDDPNWKGSAERANRFNVDFADEVHFNAGGGSGVEVFVHPGTASWNKRFAESAAVLMAEAAGLPSRGGKLNDRFAFLRYTNMPASIVECAFLDSARDRKAMGESGYVRRSGEALARARLESLGMEYQPDTTGDEPDVDLRLRLFMRVRRMRVRRVCWGRLMRLRCCRMITGSRRTLRFVSGLMMGVQMLF